MRIKREEFEELKKKIKFLENELEYIKKRDYVSNYDVDNKISEQIMGHFQRMHEDLSDRIDNRCDNTEEKIDEKMEEIENELPAKIEEIVKSSKIEDTVLLKVVKATFNNYKEEK